MGYDLHITRKEYWSDEGPEITMAEWIDYVTDDPEMRFDGDADGSVGGHAAQVVSSGFATWICHPQHGEAEDSAWITYASGCLESKNPDQPLRRKMWSIAQRLNAQVQGDDGEFYDANGGTSTSEDSVSRYRGTKAGRPGRVKWRFWKA